MIVLLLILVVIMMLAPVQVANKAAYYRIVPPATLITTLDSDGYLIWFHAATGVTGRIQRATRVNDTGNWTNRKSCGIASPAMLASYDYQCDYMLIDLPHGPTISSNPVSYVTAAPMIKRNKQSS